MTSQHPLAGVYAAAVTPLRDSALDLESVPRLLSFLASRGCHGAVLFGTTGEGPSFSPAEREALMRCAREATRVHAGLSADRRDRHAESFRNDRPDEAGFRSRFRRRSGPAALLLPQSHR